MLHLSPATEDTAAPLFLNRQPAPKPVINLLELAEVLAKTPEAVRRAAPLDILRGHLYGLAFEKETLIEEVQAVFESEKNRRAQPLMRLA